MNFWLKFFYCASLLQNPSRIWFRELCAHLLSVTQEKFGYLWLPISPFAHLTVRHSDSLSPQHPSPSPASANPSDTSPLRKGSSPADSVIPMEYNSHRPRRRAELEELISSTCQRVLTHFHTDSKSQNLASRLRSTLCVIWEFLCLPFGQIQTLQSPVFFQFSSG